MIRRGVGSRHRCLLRQPPPLWQPVWRAPLTFERACQCWKAVGVHLLRTCVRPRASLSVYTLMGLHTAVRRGPLQWRPCRQSPRSILRLLGGRSGQS